MGPFDTPYTTFYWSTIVNIALSATVFELFNVEWYHDLEIWERGHSRSFKPVPFESLSAVFYWPSIVTMALFCIICEIEWDIGLFIPPLHSTPPGSRRNITMPFGTEKLEWWGYPMVKKIEDIYNGLDTILACDRRTDILPRHSPRYAVCISVAW